MATTLLRMMMGSMLATSECCLYTVACLCLVLPRHLCETPYSSCTLPPTLHRWFSLVMYMAFLFTVIVVLLNVLIAQMSDTYSKLQENNDGAFNLIRASYISNMQKTASNSFSGKEEVRN